MQVKVKILPAMGAAVGSWEYITLSRLVTRYLPRLSMTMLCCKQFPPLHVVNEELESGGGDLGMSGGCLWKPFQISLEQYYEVKEEALTDPSFELSYDDELESKETLKKWCGAVSSKHNPRRNK